MSVANRREPVTLVRSPTFTNSDSGVIVERLQARQAGVSRQRGNGSGCPASGGGSDGPDVRRGRAAAAADEVERPRIDEFRQDARGLRRLLVIAAERVGQARVGIAGHEHVRDARQLLEVRPQLLRAQGAVEADAERPGVAHARPEGLHRLTGQGPPGGIRDGAADHDRQPEAEFLEDPLDREDGRLGVEGVEDGLDEQHVGAALDQTVCGIGVRRHELVPGDAACPRIVHVRRQRCGPGRGTQGTCHETRPPWLRALGGVGGAPGQSCRFPVHLASQ